MNLNKFKKILPYALFILIGYFLADLVILNYRDLMLPKEAPPSRPKRTNLPQTNGRGFYTPITSRNIFNSDGIIPDALVAKGQENKSEQKEEVPVASQLPLNLVGTIVHSIPEKSIANIEIKSKNQVLAFSPKREIDNMATLIKVERYKAIIRNTNNGRLEFIEMKNLTKINFAGAKAEAVAPTEIKMTGANKYEIKRSDVIKYTSDMANVLQQAAMAPRKKANGEIDCFKFLAIQPDSIYTKLSFQNGDCIKSVNGESIDNPAKAMELYNALKSSSQINLKVERDGKDQDMEYNIR